MNIINYFVIANQVEMEHRRIIRNRQIRNIAADAFNLSDQKFFKLFRLTKPLVRNLIEDLTPYMKQRQRRSMLDIKIKILTALHFFANGSYQTSVGQNLYLAISQASVSRCINEVVDALNQPNIMNRWITFPNTLNKLTYVRQKFFENHRFPGVIGCIDCTHVAIFPPETHIENLYVNRKGYHSINVQIKSATQQEQTDQEIIEKLTREFLENGWQLLFNTLTIHRNSTVSDKRSVRLECLNHIRQELIKLYTLESISDNCPSKQQSLLSHDMPCNEEQQSHQPPLDQKIADS